MVTDTPSRSASWISFSRSTSARAWRNASPTRSWRWEGPAGEPRSPPRMGWREEERLGGRRDIFTHLSFPPMRASRYSKPDLSRGPARISPAGMTGLQRALNGFDLETLDHVALLHVLIVGEGHAAFLAALNLFHFILEALERGQIAFVNHDIVADQAHLGPAAHDALGDAATGHLADLGDVEHFQDLGKVAGCRVTEG